MALTFNPGNIVARDIDPTQVHPEILKIVTEILDLRLNTFESTIAVSARDYFAFGEEGRLFMALQMGRMLGQPVMWVKDGMHSNVDRWVLGPCERFIAGPHMIVSVNGIAVVVPRPPPQLLEEAPGATTQFVNAPERRVKITRPPNAFILYRSDYQAQIKQMNPQLQNNDISGILGKAWNNESHEVRERYKALAKAYKERHNKMHPDYRYTPRKPSEKRRRNRRSTSA
ncbi:HMG box protein [Colletotrichum scovillei]|uniref:Mating-type protein n=1 Tax=Colletotrichum scovillei TaxID=1209932 RepID=A0A9P7R690_9PEZI|nr:mating type protein mat1-2-1 [Colletotrichum scovillei]KAF4773506.1 HMG box protein [Colletotrichum scovillei]KAG7048929.1 mating-type protein [Colletotrichum scovillei]KAG7066094.1 mating-type protein [Colletotrichum scovillei]KAG7068693.1 mating-type protein [Colletotrichum scovillei]